MNENEELIDPQSWTQKELVKHLYREILEIKSGQKTMIEVFEAKQREGVSTIKIKQADFESRIRNLEDDFNKRKGWYAAAVAIISVVFSIISNFLSKEI